MDLALAQTQTLTQTILRQIVTATTLIATIQIHTTLTCSLNSSPINNFNNKKNEKDQGQYMLINILKIKTTTMSMVINITIILLLLCKRLQTNSRINNFNNSGAAINTKMTIHYTLIVCKIPTKNIETERFKVRV